MNLHNVLWMGANRISPPAGLYATEIDWVTLLPSGIIYTDGLLIALQLFGGRDISAPFSKTFGNPVRSNTPKPPKGCCFVRADHLANASSPRVVEACRPAGHRHPFARWPGTRWAARRCCERGRQYQRKQRRHPARSGHVLQPERLPRTRSPPPTCNDRPRRLERDIELNAEGQRR